MVFLQGGGAPGEFALEDGLVNKFLVTALMVVFLALAPGPPALAQTAVEYGALVSKNQGGGKLGSSLNHKFGSVRTKGSRPRQSQARHWRPRKSPPRARSWRHRESKPQARHWRTRQSKPRVRSWRTRQSKPRARILQWKSARKM
jgi:hypothetical protein